MEFAIHLLHPIVLVRVFSQPEYGLYRQLMLLFSTLLPIGQLGMTQALYYFMPRSQENKHAIVLQTVIFATGSGALVLCGLLLFSGPIAGLFHSSEMAGYIPFVGLYSFFMIASSAIEPTLIAERRTKLASSVLVISQLAQSCIIIGVVLIRPEIHIVLYALAVFGMGRFCVQLFYFYRRYRWTFKSFDKATFKEQIAYALPVGIGNIAWFFQLKLNQFFVSFFFDAKNFAIYSVGSFKMPLVNIVTASVANVMIPELSRFQKLKRNKEILRIWYNSVRKMNLIIYPLFIFFFFFADEFIVALFTREYLESAVIFRISLLGLAVVGINAGAVLNAYAQTKYLMNLGFARLPITVLILYAFTSMWGMVGAMSANVLLSVLFQGIVLLKVSKVMEINFFKVLQWEVNAKILGAALISVFPLVLGKGYLHIPPLGVLLLAGPLFLAGYASLSILFGTLNRQEVRYFQETIKQLIGTRFNKNASKAPN
jgi:O-antigen/teichoic acid export membrane protein